MKGVVALIACGLRLASCEPNIVELAESVPELSTLVAAVVGGDLVDTLSSPGPFTVFAPTNDAFAKLPPGTLDALMKPENKDQLVDILTYHVLPEEVKAGDLDSFQAVTTVEGKPLHAVSWGGKVQVGPSLSSLSTVTSADNSASNGVVHIIDQVLLPPAAPAPSPAGQSIVDLAKTVPELSTLVEALVAGGLVDTLASPGPFTVFAPSNRAFERLPPGTVESLLKPENKDQLVDILTFHVLPGRVLSTDLDYEQKPTTLEGKPLDITSAEGLVIIRGNAFDGTYTFVESADNLATNGVVHIIDDVLNPSGSAVVV
jgi:uncharacterized surface protein with fasciclin (FAS1) repeats